MPKTPYMKRVCDEILSLELQAAGAVLIEGPKWCGKSRTAEEKAKSAVMMQDADKAASYLKMAKTMPSLLLRGETPHLVDEWQVAPVLWDAVRSEVDRRGGMGHFILTGSATPPDGNDDEEEPVKRRHTGTGRIARMKMRPMTLWESGESTGGVSLAALFSGEGDVGAECSLSIPDIARLVCRGGWPESIGLPEKVSFRVASNYVKAVVEEDIHRVDGIEKNPDRVRSLLRSLSRNISTLATIETISGNMQANDATASDKTVAAYLNALRRLFLVEDTPAWMPTLRSRTAIRSSSKRQFVDPSIATASMSVGPDKLLRDFNTFGFLFESLCTRDLRVYAQALDGTVSHYRDKNGLEADLVVSLPDGRWAPVEVKMGEGEIEEAAANLRKLAGIVDPVKTGAPAFMMVLTGTPFAYRRPDGVIVCPLGCLRP
ncbi:MAG: ATP-binding protein [Kiritimatiellae bacterium]|nr:ATP-binding protein [Kiritimatiellia bacterium]